VGDYKFFENFLNFWSDTNGSTHSLGGAWLHESQKDGTEYSEDD
jgi:hypothetical protein